ncbi:FmdB family zinc ribbon protein [Planctomycetota bacterium]
MPTYEYECKKCNHRFEKFQKMKDKALKTCPECGGHIHRVLGAGLAVIVKGSGSQSIDYTQRKNHCDRETPCCGRDTFCDIRPCDT